MMQYEITKTQRVRRAYRAITAALCVRTRPGPAPLTPAHRFRQFCVEIILHVLADRMTEDDGRNVRRRRSVGISITGIRPKRRADRVHVLAQSCAWDRLQGDR